MEDRTAHLAETFREKVEVVSPAFLSKVFPYECMECVAASNVNFELGVHTCFGQSVVEPARIVKDRIFRSAGDKEARQRSHRFDVTFQDNQGIGEAKVTFFDAVQVFSEIGGAHLRNSIGYEIRNLRFSALNSERITDLKEPTCRHDCTRLNVLFEDLLSPWLWPFEAGRYCIGRDEVCSR